MDTNDSFDKQHYARQVCCDLPGVVLFPILTSRCALPCVQQPPLPAPSVYPDTDASSCQCHESGSRQDLCAKLFAGSGWMKSAGNRGVIQSRLQMLHVHVFLVAPLGARHVAKSGADQHQGGISVKECPHHPRPGDHPNNCVNLRRGVK